MTPAGWRLVPVEPTDEITDAGSFCGGVPIHPAVWASMLAAAVDPLQDERLIELVARTAYEDMRAPHEWNWPNEDEHIRSGYIGTARAVLALFRGEGR